MKKYSCGCVAEPVKGGLLLLEDCREGEIGVCFIPEGNNARYQDMINKECWDLDTLESAKRYGYLNRLVRLGEGFKDVAINIKHAIDF